VAGANGLGKTEAARASGVLVAATVARQTLVDDNAGQPVVRRVRASVTWNAIANDGSGDAATSGVFYVSAPIVDVALIHKDAGSAARPIVSKGTRIALEGAHCVATVGDAASVVDGAFVDVDAQALRAIKGEAGELACAARKGAGEISALVAERARESVDAVCALVKVNADKVNDV
jgi:hypothetical protein